MLFNHKIIEIEDHFSDLLRFMFFKSRHVIVQYKVGPNNIIKINEV